MNFPNTLRILHIITDLNGFGGTEATLLRYLNSSGLPKQCHKVVVLKSIGTGSVFGAQIQEAGFEILELNLHRSFNPIWGLFRLLLEARKFKPNILSGWLYHPSFIASMISYFCVPPVAVVWHIRSLTFSSISKTPTRYLVQRLLLIMSKFSKPVVVSNSRVALSQHAAIGFNLSDKITKVVCNGIDTADYYPNALDRCSLRRELQIPHEAIVIGCVSRFVPEKGYHVLFEALRILKSSVTSDVYDRIYLMCAGHDVTYQNPELSYLLGDVLPPHRIRLLGLRSDINRILRCFDCFVLPSISEAFPNALIEAMSTALPCITTDVGESAHALGGGEYVVEPNNPDQLARAIGKCIQLDKVSAGNLGVLYRARVENEFSLTRMANEFDSLFLDVAEKEDGA